jgi:hypothetical protein
MLSIKNSNDVAVLVAACLALTAASLAQAAPADPMALRAAAAAVGCKLDLGEHARSDLQKWPDAKEPEFQVVASLIGPEDGDSLGRLCVGAVRQDRGNTIREAVLTDVVRPPKKIDPIDVKGVRIDTIPFRFSPTETAVAVWVEAGLDTESVGYDYNALYLFRRQGDRLLRIFGGLGNEVTTDKTEHFKETIIEHVVRFSPHITNGAYDLIFAPKHGGKGQRYVWTGTKYAPG